MAQELEVISANLLPAATNISDNDMILIIQEGRPKRALPSAMKGKQGDPGASLYLNVTETHIQWRQGITGGWQNLIALDKIRGDKGEKPLFRNHEGILQIKYEGEPDASYINLFDREALKLNFSDLTPSEIAQLKLHFSDLTETDKEQLMKPATEAAAEVREAMTIIQSEAATAIQSATKATETAQTAANRVQDGKTPVIIIGTIEEGSMATATMTAAGMDESGNPKTALNLVLPKGKDGEPPVIKYSVLTGEPGTDVKVSQEEAGQTPAGNPIYNVTLTIPRGEQGLPGMGNGNVLVDSSKLLAGEKYMFVPSFTDSTEGTFVKYEDAPVDGKTYGRKDGEWKDVLVENVLDITEIYTKASANFTITSDTFDRIVEAYNKKCSTAYIGLDDGSSYVLPLVIVKETTGYSLSFDINSSSSTDLDSRRSQLHLSNFLINVVSATLTATMQMSDINLDHTGAGTKFLSDKGDYVEAFPEAPHDGKIYGRKDGAWTEIDTVTSEENDAYWVIFDESKATTTLERGGNALIRDDIRAKFKRCMVKPQANGRAAIAYLNEIDSTKWPDGTVAPYDNTSDGWHLMVHFPKYYYRNEDLGNNKYKLYISEKKINENYKEERECLIGAFESFIGSLPDTPERILYSAYGVESSASTTLSDFYLNAKGNGNKWGLIDYRAHKTIANMFAIMYGSTDISTSNSSIPCSGGTKPYDEGKTGGTIFLGNADGKAIVNASSSYYSTSFLGLEDCYFSKWEFVQGVNIREGGQIRVVYDGGCFPDKFDSALVVDGATNVREIDTGVASSGYITQIIHGEFADIMPASIVSGSSTTYYADYNSGATFGPYIFLRSGDSGASAYCGVFASNAYNSSSLSDVYFGSRLGFYGAIEIKTPAEWMALTPNYKG